MNARLLLATCASAALLSAAACNNANSNSTDQAKAAPDTPASAKATSGTTDEQRRPITLTGCLQKGDGSDYILTEINEPSAGGAATSGDKVEREQVNAAEHAYRLEAKNTSDDNWSNMVGRQVRVSGTLAKTGDLDQKVGTSGSNDHADKNDDRVKIHESDLARVDVSDIQQVAAACGGHAMKNTAKSAKPRRK
jgi:hypothetical protein